MELSPYQELDGSGHNAPWMCPPQMSLLYDHMAPGSLLSSLTIAALTDDSITMYDLLGKM